MSNLLLVLLACFGRNDSVGESGLDSPADSDDCADDWAGEAGKAEFKEVWVESSCLFYASCPDALADEYDQCVEYLGDNTAWASQSHVLDSCLATDCLAWLSANADCTTENKDEFGEMCNTVELFD